MDVQELHQKIIKKFGSIHNFCKINENLNRSTVYLVLKGKYPGKINKQFRKIENALFENRKTDQTIKIDCSEIITVLQNFKCNNCRLLRKSCEDCRRKTANEATAVYNYIESRE